jgi:hypothetical protein
MRLMDEKITLTPEGRTYIDSGTWDVMLPALNFEVCNDWQMVAK